MDVLGISNVREFAEHLDIPRSTPYKWKRRGKDVTPAPQAQVKLNEALARADKVLQERFWKLTDEASSDLDRESWESIISVSNGSGPSSTDHPLSEVELELADRPLEDQISGALELCDFFIEKIRQVKDVLHSAVESANGVLKQEKTTHASKHTHEMVGTCGDCTRLNNAEVTLKSMTGGATDNGSQQEAIHNPSHAAVVLENLNLADSAHISLKANVWLLEHSVIIKYRNFLKVISTNKTIESISGKDIFEQNISKLGNVMTALQEADRDFKVFNVLCQVHEATNSLLENLAKKVKELESDVR